jgi:sister-chromatid-cohesion protein PDS5
MISQFLRRIETWLEEGACDQRDLDAVHHIIKYVAKHCPAMLESHTLDLSKSLTEKNAQKKKASPLVTQSTEIYLTALAGIAKGSIQGVEGCSTYLLLSVILLIWRRGRTNRKLNPIEPDVLRAVKPYVTESNPRHAKFATRILAYSSQKKETCGALVKVRFRGFSLLRTVGVMPKIS